MIKVLLDPVFLSTDDRSFLVGKMQVLWVCVYVCVQHYVFHSWRIVLLIY